MWLRVQITFGIGKAPAAGKLPPEFNAGEEATNQGTEVHGFSRESAADEWKEFHFLARDSEASTWSCGGTMRSLG